MERLKQSVAELEARPCVEICEQERAEGNGGCGACALCCHEATERAAALAAENEGQRAKLAALAGTGLRLAKTVMYVEKLKRAAQSLHRAWKRERSRSDRIESAARAALPSAEAMLAMAQQWAEGGGSGGPEQRECDECSEDIYALKDALEDK